MLTVLTPAALYGCGRTGPDQTAGHTPAHPDDVPPVVEHNGPCAGTQLTLPGVAAELRVRAPVLVPSSKLARFEDLVELWECKGGGYVAVFDSGVDVTVMPGWGQVEPADYWARYVESNGYGQAATIHGGAGVTEEPDGSHRGLAQFFVEGWMVQLLGDGETPAADLVDIADTL
ncbi:hypothetical protein GUY44_19560 [Pimelobacter simplex]|uniref:hypothetical protein n=1 Tax=Nocardioides simplex TaxID=2045 RepID=UPI000535C085|nr:hypothetical protein [Pimelobacter simplex]MCG8152689.1 hypothetical protein [Pimelobacter simplex]GEB16935.1 hypothetical protein NSI01_52500 [Pimelobacter simplex]SFM74869.1 hypothetical protein SAMN05421671_3309 [Pimelobacter simplex]